MKVIQPGFWMALEMLIALEILLLVLKLTVPLCKVLILEFGLNDQISIPLRLLIFLGELNLMDLVIVQHMVMHL